MGVKGLWVSACLRVCYEEIKISLKHVYSRPQTQMIYNKNKKNENYKIYPPISHNSYRMAVRMRIVYINLNVFFQFYFWKIYVNAKFCCDMGPCHLATQNRLTE